MQCQPTFPLALFLARIGDHVDLGAGCAVIGDITVGDSAVWMAVDSTLISRIDPRTNSVTDQIAAAAGADAIRLGFGSLWLADHLRGDLWRVSVVGGARSNTGGTKP